MSKYIRIIPSFVLAAALLYGCSSTLKENQTDRDINKNNQDIEAYSDTSAPLPVDSSEISEEIPGKIPDSLRHLQTKVPVDRQIKDEEPVSVKTEPPVTEQPVKEMKKEVVRTGNFTVQLGAFSSDQNASNFALQAGKKLGQNLIVKLNPKTGFFVVQFGQFDTKIEAEKAAKDLKKKNFKDIFIVTTK